MRERRSSAAMLVTSMVIFGTVGVFRRAIPLPSAVIAMLRGGVGAAFLLLVLFIRGKRLSGKEIKNNLPLLLLSGAAMGVNWLLLFEAYNYTSVATATLCYYMAPIFVILAAPAVLGERLTGWKAFCVLIALIGMVLVSGVAETGFSGRSELRGMALALGAAVLYASVILMNKRMKPIGAYDKTIVQLLSAAAVLLVYVFCTGELSGFSCPAKGLWMLAIVCVVHTGVAYALYFGCMDGLPAHILALFSYIDPVVAVLLSALLLHEELTLLTGIGAVLVLGGAVLIDLKKKE